MNIPNFLTLSRIILIPIMLFCHYKLPVQYAAIVVTVIFTISAITDFVDGYIARKFNQTSLLGKFSDPIADKLVVITALIIISENYHSMIISIPIIIIISREIIISGLREWVALNGNYTSVEVKNIGKYKTFSQMLAIILLLLNYNKLYVIGIVLLYIAMFLTLFSMIIYLYHAQIFNNKH